MNRQLPHDDVFRRLCAARDLIHEHYDRPLALDDLARRACFSRYHFLRLFRDAFGATPHEYLTRVRLDQAKQRLVNEQGSVTDVCFDVGFQSLGSFSTLFAERIGCPPGAWRRRYWQVATWPEGNHLQVPWCFSSRCGEYRPAP